MRAQRPAFSPQPPTPTHKHDPNTHTTSQRPSEYEISGLSGNYPLKSVHQPILLNYQTQKMISHDVVRLRATVTPKTPDRFGTHGSFGTEVQKAEKFNGFLCRTIGVKSGEALKSRLSQQLSDEKQKPPPDPNTASTSKLNRNPELQRLNGVKSSQNLFDSISGFHQYERLNDKINKNKQLIEQLRKGTRKEEVTEKAKESDSKSNRGEKSPVCAGLENRKQFNDYQLKRKVGSANTSKLDNASIDAKVSSSPVLQKRGIQSGKTSHASFTTVQENQQRHLLVKKSITNRIGIEQFSLGRKLGEGKYGVVHMALHPQTGGIFAIKKISKSLISTKKMINQYSLQIRLQSSLSHGHILPMYGFFDDKTHLYIVLEYMEGGTLYSKLAKEGRFSERETADVIRQIAKAVEYLHDLGIAHRDIKPENVVVADKVCRLCDFGWAVLCTDRRKTYCGTCDYVAPEILEGIEYDMSVDLWCLGVMTFELLTGRAPFFHISRKETAKKILNVQNQNLVYPSDLSENAKDFLDKLIRKNPEQRIKAGVALQHPFLLQLPQN